MWSFPWRSGLTCGAAGKRQSRCIGLGARLTGRIRPFTVCCRLHSLNEQAAVSRFVGHAHALVVGIPSKNLFRRPIQNQFTRNHPPQLHVNGKKAPLAQGGLPSLLLRFIRSILRTAAVTCHLPAHRRRRAPNVWLCHEATNQERALANCPSLNYCER
jgi:hypothetical protein